MDAIFIQGRNSCVMDEDESLGSFYSLLENSSENLTGSSTSSDLTEDTASSSSSSSSSSYLLSSSCKGPLFEMSSLKEQLPFKRGLSKFYQGKSQSFTSFSNIKCLEDLVKPERPLKKLKTSKSCGGGLDSKRSVLTLKCSNKRIITKKASKASFSSSISARRNCFLGSKPPLYPQKPRNLSDQSLWFS